MVALILTKVRNSSFSDEVITMLPGEIAVPFTTMSCANQNVQASKLSKYLCKGLPEYFATL